ESREALVVAAGDAIEHLIDDAVDAVIAGVTERNAGRLRVREREAGIVEALIAEARAGVVPGSDPISARKAFGVLALIGQIARLRDEKGAAAKAGNGAGRKRRRLIGAVASAGIAAEHGRLKCPLVDGRDPNANPRGGQRIGRSSGRKIGGEKGGPADGVVDEVRSRLALEKLAVRRHQAGANGQAVIEGVLLVPEGIEPSDRSSLEIRNGENIVEICRTEKRPVGDEAVGVKFATLPSHELLQIEIELRLKHPDRDGAGPDPAAHIGQKIVGIVEGEGDAVAVEIGPQSTPIAGQRGGGRGRWGRFRAVALRPGRRPAIRGHAQVKRGKGERPRPTTSGARAHILRPPERIGREFPLRFRQNVVASSPPRHRRVTNGGYASGCSSAVVVVRSNGASQAGEGSMLDGVMLLWFVLTAAALLFVAVDIRTTPESAVLKWGFVLLTAYTGVIGAFLYLLGCREPPPGLHERYVAARWRQTLGSTLHCVAGGRVGILAGAVLSSVFGLAGLVEVVVEYILGFAFGWTIFQALFMRDMAGGSYLRALRSTFVAELLSMNLLMAGMVPTVMALKSRIP